MTRARSRPATVLRLALVAVCAVALSGCVSLLPKTKPAQLYRFGHNPVAEAAGPTAPGARVGVFRAIGSFQREAAGDRLLTITGERAAYVARSRWVAPATVLFDQALVTAFEATPGRVRLVSRGERAPAAYALRTDVRNFETRYDAGPDAAPTIVVRVRATLTSNRDNAVVAEQVFESSIRAGDNRVGAFVTAYDRATAEVLQQLVAWTNAQAVPAA
jgi:cholesterol transport system auxiliary component